MAKQGITPGTPWVANSAAPYADQSYKDGDRPSGGGGGEFSDADYPLTPAYNETGAIFFDSAATGAVDGSSWADAYADEETALNALCASSAGTMLTCRGTFDCATGIVLSGDGGVGNSSNWYVFRADPVEGCDITASDDTGIEFGGQKYWIVDGFNQTGGSRIFSYSPGGSSTGGLDHMTIRHITGTMGFGGDNVGTVHMDTAGADYIGVFDCDITGPGTGAHGNTACVFFSRVPHWRIHNCELNNAPKLFYYKHFETSSYAGLENQYFINNYIYGGGQVRVACKGAEFDNNIFDTEFYFKDDGGGDNGCDDNVFTHNTVTDLVELSNLDNIANDNEISDNIIEGQYLIVPFQTATASTNTSNYNLFGSSIRYQNTTHATVAAWQAASVPSGQDVNSVGGLPTYIGGASPSTIAGFALNGGNGAGAGGGGTDMGADVSTVGLN